ncbi:MAG: CYTH domain-containing protein, partial [Planctomycetes bacterium]|nr:CYTH domain-containing protein [Planctomycetota bacterium]
MQYEVEQKYPVADLAALETSLTALGAELQPPQLEVDLYYAHPARDFAATDEA